MAVCQFCRVTLTDADAQRRPAHRFGAWPSSLDAEGRAEDVVYVYVARPRAIVQGVQHRVVTGGVQRERVELGGEEEVEPHTAVEVGRVPGDRIVGRGIEMEAVEPVLISSIYGKNVAIGRQ